MDSNLRNSISTKMTRISRIFFVSTGGVLVVGAIVFGLFYVTWFKFWAQTKEASLVKQLTSVGGSVVRKNEGGKGAEVIGVTFRNSLRRLTADDLKLVQGFRHLTSLDLSGCGIESSHLRIIAGNSRLKALRIDGNAVDPTSIGELRHCPLLELLAVTMCLDDDGYASIRQLKSLRFVELVDCTFDPRSQSPRLDGMLLEGLTISSSSIRTFDLECVTGLNNLRTLVVHNMDLTLDAARYMSKVPNTAKVLLIDGHCNEIDSLRRLRAAGFSQMAFHSCEFSVESHAFAKKQNWTITGEPIIK